MFSDENVNCVLCTCNFTQVMGYVHIFFQNDSICEVTSLLHGERWNRKAKIQNPVRRFHKPEDYSASLESLKHSLYLVRFFESQQQCLFLSLIFFSICSSENIFASWVFNLDLFELLLQVHKGIAQPLKQANLRV